MTKKKVLLALALSMTAALASATPAGTTVDFSHGYEGWGGSQPGDGIGGTRIDGGFGVDAPALRTVIENFGVTFGTSTNQAFLGDYTKSSSVTLGIDVSTQSIKYFGQEVTRSLVVELRDYDHAQGGLPYTSVWYTLGTLDASKPGFQHLSVTIDNTSSSLLPAGWGGYGAEGANGAPMLPGDRSFASVLASVDELVFTTFVPGYAYGFSNHDIAVDNISISAVPEPESVAMMLSGLGMLGWLARRKKRQATAA
jgi:hypothetical protein